MYKDEKSLKRTVGILILTVSVFVTGFVGGRIFEGSSGTIIQKIKQQVTTSDDVDFDLFWEVWNTVKNGYVEEEVVDEDEMFYGSIKGMVDSLGDPATVFLDPEETDEFNMSNEGKYFEGIGAELGYDDGAVIIVSPLEGSPAKEAGIRPGDVILKVDDHEVSSTDTVYDVVALIRGEAGTTVTLQVLHKGDFTPVDIKIERKEITVPSMNWELVGEDEDIALIHLDRFTDSSYIEWTSNWNTLVDEVVESGVDKVIVDVRGNPGGYFDAAVYAADDFLGDGKIVAQQRDRDGDLDVYKTSSGGKLLTQEVVVLVDAGSASASEILAGALQQNDRAELVGEDTYGKGTAQSVIDFTDGSSLHLTILQWLLPDGEGLTRDNPISPDVEVEYTGEDFVNGDDPRLDKAIEMLLD
jgi:carboxyl-terminal processing protease